MDAIMERLPAKSAAAAACVRISWSRSATRLLSAPNFVTAVSFNPNLGLKRILGSRIPTIACFATGIIGLDSISDEQKEIKWRQPTYEIRKAACRRIINEQHGLAVTIGHFPGLKKEANPRKHQGGAEKEPPLVKEKPPLNRGSRSMKSRMEEHLWRRPLKRKEQSNKEALTMQCEVAEPNALKREYPADQRQATFC